MTNKRLYAIAKTIAQEVLDKWGFVSYHVRIEESLAVINAYNDLLDSIRADKNLDAMVYDVCIETLIGYSGEGHRSFFELNIRNKPELLKAVRSKLIAAINWTIQVLALPYESHWNQWR